MPVITKAPPHVVDLLNKVKDEHHPHLETASVAVCFVDSKPFPKGRFNWGKASKFTDFVKLWQKNKHDFCIMLCADVWFSILDESQREALLDLHLSCCDVEYEPVTEIVGGKKAVVKDEWGRTQFTDQMKLDDEGVPKWKVNPLDLMVFAENVRKYGLWCDQFEPIHEAVSDAHKAEK